MPLKLTITGCQTLFPGQEETKEVVHGTLTIGRAPQNDWVLYDPERFLSGRHCHIEYQDDRYFITDTSTNGVYLNNLERRLERGQTAELHDGDRLVMGGYEIAVRITPAETDPTDTEAVTDIVVRDPPLGGREALDHTPAAAVPPQPYEPYEATPVPVGLPRLPDEPLFEALPDAELTPEDSGLFRPAAKPVAPMPEPDYLAPERAFFQPPAAAPEELHQDLAAPVEAAPEQVAEGPGAARQEESLIPENWYLEPLPEEPPAVFPPSAPPPEAAFLAAQSAESGAAAALSPESAAAAVQAFLNGAGLLGPGVAEDEQPLEVMTRLGEIFRCTVQGLMEVLIARGSVKGEFRMDRTMLGREENNPLKFADSVEGAMTLLLKPQPGFMPPVQAVHQGFEDIKIHQLAVMAGVQSALNQLLKRFDPVTLEVRLGKHSMLESVLPSKRKARYWDAFKALYGDLIREAEDDFHELFGKEFAQAYEEQVRNL